MIHPEGINIHRTIVLEAYISKNNHCNNRYDKDRSQTYAMCTFSVWNHDRKDYTPFEQKDLPKMFKSWISEFKCILYDRYNFQDMYIHSAIEATLCPKIIRQGVRVIQFWLIFSNAKNFNITEKTSKSDVAEMISDTKRKDKVKASTPIKDKQAQVHLLKIKKPRIFVPNAFTDESPDLHIYICT